MFNSIYRAIRNWRIERVTIAKLSRLDHRALADIGINPGQIAEIAHRSAWGA